MSEDEKILADGKRVVEIYTAYLKLLKDSIPKLLSQAAKEVLEETERNIRRELREAKAGLIVLEEELAEESNE